MPLFDWWVKEKLNHLSGRFDSKYWPSIDDFIREIADDAEQATPLAQDAATAASTTGKRSSPTDFFSALFEEIAEVKQGYEGFLPHDFSLSDSTLAALGTCVLDRAADEPFTADYVKQLRQRLRRRGEA